MKSAPEHAQDWKTKRVWLVPETAAGSPGHLVLRVLPHVSELAVVVVGRAVVFQHVLDDVAPGPAGKYHLAVLIAHVLRQFKKR